MRIFVAGHVGMVGSAICRKLASRSVDVLTKSRAELDLTDQSAVRSFFRTENVDAVILAAAKVGGILANNSYPADFIFQNLMIECNVINEAYRAGVQRLLFLGSSCIYPREAEQPIKEEALLRGPLEPTNEPYAIAKIAGIKLCESYNRQFGTDYRSVMPTNLYGPGDNFDPDGSHVVPALIRRFTEAVRNQEDEVVIWGSGRPRREFLHVDDMADASLFVFGLPRDVYASHTSLMQSHLNVGSGSDITIRELAALIAAATGFAGRLTFDQNKPDGTMRKLMDSSRLAELGWTATIPLDVGIADTVRWFRSTFKISGRAKVSLSSPAQ